VLDASAADDAAGAESTGVELDITAESFETSPQQEALWLSEPEGPTARVQGVFAWNGALDADRLGEALRRCVARHEILRTTFQRQPGIRVPFQAVHGQLDPVVQTSELSNLDDEAARSELDALRAAALSAPVDLAGGPLVSLHIATLDAERHRVILTVSGLGADAGSLAVLAGDLLDAYGDAAPATDDPLQYADFAAWQRQLASSDEDERRAADAFWREAAGASAPRLPFAEPTAGGPLARIPIAIDAELAGALSAAAVRLGAGADALVQAAWHVLLARLSGEEAATVAYRSAEHRHDDLVGAVGAFARPVPVTLELAEGTPFADVVRAVAREREQALVRQDYAPTQGAPGLTIGFTSAPAFTRSTGGVSVGLEDVIVRESPTGLQLVCGDGERLTASIAFDSAAYDEESARRLAEELETFLRGVAANPDADVRATALVGPREHAQVIQAFNATAAPAGEALVHERFAQHAADRPDAPAVNDGERSLTYGELNAQANQLAHRLQRTGVQPGATVGLCTDRSVDTIVGLLGILKAGAAYVPVHHEHPPARLAHQLRTAEVAAVVTQAPLLERLSQFEGETVCLDRDREALAGEPTSAPDAATRPDGLAYVIYTSGSTGTPKGVGVTHANLRNYAAFITSRLAADGERCSFGLITAISTDLGNTSVFGALASGGSLVLIDPTVAADPAALARQLARTPVDVLKITPSHIGALLSGGDRGVLPRRTLVLGGERAPWDLVARVRELGPELEIINHYGPTEATIGCSTFTVGEGPGRWRPATVPIGQPISGDAIYLLDPHANPVPIGVAGRLYVAGAGVASGYIGSPELTAERFLSDPFQPDDADPAHADEAGGRVRRRSAGRMYDTGDLARWLPDGTLEFLGRVDEQVKIRGYRVEPAEVESALRTHGQVREAVVVARSAPSGEPQLVAYVVLRESAETAELERHLADWVPEYMLPSAIVVLDALPQTPSGKVDRLALPEPELAAAGSSGSYVGPRTPMEEAVVEIWSRVLGVDRISVDGDFFELGGHSLLVTQVVAQVRSDFAIELPLHSIFVYPTVELFTAEIVRIMGESEEDETAKLLAELKSLSDEDAERLLAGDEPRH
jgi:amino acid adenylation domain-containing protein